jgi:hypothetical protein
VYDCTPGACLPQVRPAGHRCQRRGRALQGLLVHALPAPCNQQAACWARQALPLLSLMTRLWCAVGHGDAVWRAGQGGRRRDFRRPGHDDRADPRAGPLQAAAEAAAARADGRGPEQRAGVTLQGSGLQEELVQSLHAVHFGFVAEFYVNDQQHTGCIWRLTT